jgi:predicted nucleic acid-binding Zn ribbon protein
MADEADRANDQAQQMLDIQLRQRKPVGPQPHGYCHYCGAEWVEVSERIFCDKECAADYEKEAQARKRNGTQQT